MDKLQYTKDLQSEAEAKELAKYICIGKLVDEGMIEPEGTGMKYLYNATIEVQEQEKGNLQEIGAPVCKLSFAVKTIENGQPFPQMKKGNSYRFYIRESTVVNELRTFRVTDR